MNTTEYNRRMKRAGTNPYNPIKQLAVWKRVLRIKYSWRLHLRYLLVVILIKSSDEYRISAQLKYSSSSGLRDSFERKLIRDNPNRSILEIKTHVAKECQKYHYS